MRALRDLRARPRGTAVAHGGSRVGLAVPNEHHSDLELAILRYCADHPNAADTLDGVRRWWLADPTRTTGEVEAALDALVAAGLLDIRRLPDGTAIYFTRARGSD